MDPVSIAGLALGVASISLQVYTGCVQGIQLLITAINFPEECRYLNLRLRMEQQRLFAWSETSGLLDLDGKNPSKVLESNTFSLHRQTVLDLLVQVQTLFKEFQEHQQKNSRLQTTPDREGVLQTPEKDAAAANFPLPEKRKRFIKKAMSTLQEASQEAVARLKWVSFDKAAFEILLSRFSSLNDNMTNILDAKMQVEIHDTVQDTNRSVLQLHRKITDLSRLVMALNIKLEATSSPASTSTPIMQMTAAQKRANADGLQLISQLAKFKAFNESIESDKKTPWDDDAVKSLDLGNTADQKHLVFDRSMIELDPVADDPELPRCEALLKLPGAAPKKVWIEWKDYDRQRPGDLSPPKEVILERVQKLAALLNHTPKPEAFRTPHCLGFFDKASSSVQPSSPGTTTESDDEDILNMRLGLVFERPQDDDLHTSLPPISLRELLQTARKPRVTDRIKLAHAISNCVLYLHAVNWLHKGLRSHNVVFFRTTSGHVDYTKPYLSGFDFSRPARADEMTDVPGPGDDAEYNLYRHPNAQSTIAGDERERFKKSFDIYSLGVLFVEIARWSTVEDVLGIDINAARGRPSIALRVRDNLLAEEQIAELGACMGEVYEIAVRKCLEGGRELGLGEKDDETDDRVAARLSMVLHEQVVKPLGDVRI
ncbi:prion-inhibition and propagation-domain-containing protein [Cercophora newfieldiana]|uniref:Prion-inhibition and propagation-domain-containing protein n=1 Tax=Cercophora newfieldiana TaxID=92897 RepID=A0AA39Y5Y7_9PEZI|nr:prion-inhibition and propagation-domain-containing protein [Cercophora newfieldiana]